MLSIIITCLNEPRQLADTLDSLFSTWPQGTPGEVIIVDDASSKPIPHDPRCTETVRNPKRCGVGPSRHIGAMISRSNALLFTDCHMRFKPGWAEKVLKHLDNTNLEDLLCGGCLLLQEPDRLDVNQPNGRSAGATYNFYGPDKNDSMRKQVLEVIWQTTPTKPALIEVPAVMGASYVMSREWYFQLDPLQHLRSWGGDELMLSLKTWRAGGRVMLMNDVDFGHVFRAKARLPESLYTIPEQDVYYNKLFALHTLFPDDLAGNLIGCFPKRPAFIKAQGMIRSNWAQIEIERHRNRSIFSRDIRWLLERFRLPFPGL